MGYLIMGVHDENKRKKIKIKLNKRGVIILVALLFIVSTATTFLIMQAVKRNKTPDETTVDYPILHQSLRQ